MTTTDARHLLDSKQVASFVARGFLRFDEIVPRALCDEALAEIAAGTRPSSFRPSAASPRRAGRASRSTRSGPTASALAAIVHSPAIAGIIQSLVGPARDLRPPLRARHRAQPALEPALARRRDRRSARTAFDIQLFFFFQDTPRAMGGTMILPGSHLRRVNESDDRALPELRRPDPDGVQRRARCWSATTASGTAASPTSPDPPRDAEAAPEPQRAAAAALEHRRSRRPAIPGILAAPSRGTATRRASRS